MSDRSWPPEPAGADQPISRSADQPISERIHALARRLWPLNRSLTGEGARQTLAVLNDSLLPSAAQDRHLCMGDERAYFFLPSRNGQTLSDAAARPVQRRTDSAYKVYSWRDRGSDERQYCASGVDLPIAAIRRRKLGEYPQHRAALVDLAAHQLMLRPPGRWPGRPIRPMAGWACPAESARAPRQPARPFSCSANTSLISG